MFAPPYLADGCIAGRSAKVRALKPLQRAGDDALDMSARQIAWWDYCLFDGGRLVD